VELTEVGSIFVEESRALHSCTSTGLFSSGVLLVRGAIAV
jgi:hypothetical protein